MEDREKLDILEDQNEDRTTDETSFDDLDRLVSQRHDEDVTPVDTTDRINTSDDDRKHDRSVINLRKKFFRDELDMMVNKGDGASSKELLEQTTVSYGKKSGKADGLLFKSVKVMIREKGKDGKIVRNNNKSNKKIIKITNEFMKLLEKVKIEHSKTLAGAVEEVNSSATTSEEVVEDVISHVIPESGRIIEEKEEELSERMKGMFLSEQEIREIIGSIHPVGSESMKIEALDIQADEYRLKALEEKDLGKKQLYRTLREIVELKADNLRFRLGERPVHKESVFLLTNEIMDNDLNRLEKFKNWAKKNMVGLSGIAITIAGIVTTVVLSTRKAVRSSAKAVGRFAKALGNLGKKLGPILAPVIGFVSQALTWGVKATRWLANNLWVLVLFLTYLVYDYFNKRK